MKTVFVVLKAIDPLGGIKSWKYDESYNLLEESDELGRINSYKYDEFGGTFIENIAGCGVTIYGYNKFDLLSQKMLSNGAKFLFEYDMQGNLLMVKDALGGEVKYTYDNGFPKKECGKFSWCKNKFFI